MSTVVRSATSEDRLAWDAFVSEHSGANVCHLFAWKEVFERAYAKQCHYLVVSDDEAWRGVLPMVAIRSPFSGRRLVSLPFLDRGGPLATDEDAYESLRNAGLELARETRARALDLRGDGREPVEGPGEPTAAESDAKRVVVFRSLPEDRDELWKAIGPKVRNLVRKSEKSGIVTERAEAEELPVFYHHVFKHNMRDLGSPVHSQGFFREILSAHAGASHLYLSRDGAGKVVAGAISIRFRDTVTVPWASALRSARNAAPNYSLYWKILDDARDEGARLFDFGRSALDSGTLHFKKQWRGEIRPLQWSSFTPDGARVEEREVSSRDHGGLARVWSKLPVGVASTLGPWIRKHLPN